MSRRLSSEQVRQFREEGYLVLPGLITPEELSALSRDADRLIETAWEGAHGDFYWKTSIDETRKLPYRVEYVIDKSAACRRLLAHPGLLGAIEDLQGPDFIPTWDSLVFKDTLRGAAHAWHRDGLAYEDLDLPIDHAVAAIDVGIYLDNADRRSCIWVIPRSHRWSSETAAAHAEQLGTAGFDERHAVPVTVQQGDVVFHNVLTLHGSPETSGLRRRVVYLEFRQQSVEIALGPHTPAYLPLKQNVLRRCIAERKACGSLVPAPEFRYRGADAGSRDVARTSFRIDHCLYWRHPIALDPEA